MFKRGGTPPFLPRPLGVVEELGLSLSEAVQAVHAGEHLVPGSRALRAQIEYGRGDQVTNMVIPVEELSLAAEALARLHTCSVRLDESLRRTGAKEAKGARQRADVIARRHPALAEEVHRLAHLLATHLERFEPEAYRPAHGGFKASQLLFINHRVYIIDFDGFCLSDSALDVGYFLAYLRPKALWYERPGMMPWFKAAEEAFTAAYRHALLELGVSQTVVDGILHRSKLYEAAVLFKIAASRANRLNSPRLNEVSVMLKEIAACVSIFG